MDFNKTKKNKPLLLLVAGAKGAIGSTLATAVAALQEQVNIVVPSMTTGDKFSWLGPLHETRLAGWDVNAESLLSIVKNHGIVPGKVWEPVADRIEAAPILGPPSATLTFQENVERLVQDMQQFKDLYPHHVPVLINLLPAGLRFAGEGLQCLDQVYDEVDPQKVPDLPFAVAAVLSGVPIVNFTPNVIEIPAIVNEAQERNVPLAGRDGKTGQTYLKTVLASAFNARSLHVDGWYSLNLLGNADGANLMVPEKAAGKLANKTELLDDILGYSVGEEQGAASHKVHIDYYAPRGDAKEAWDVIDFHGLFGLPMSLRINLQGRDSILAAPMVLDLTRWVAALQSAGRGGLIPELAFYFKKPGGENPPITFQDQVRCLEVLEGSLFPNVK